jgi:carbonic anhydrase
VQAAIDAELPDATSLPPFINALVEKIVPSVREERARETAPQRSDATEVGRLHLRHTVAELLERSEIMSSAVAAGTLAVVGANYRLAEGRVVPEIVVGTV